MPLSGVEDSERNTEGWMQQNWDKITVEFRDEVVGMVNEAMRRCPVDTGRLISTIPNVSGIETYEDHLVGIVGCGTEYGVYVHEDLTKYHKWPGQAKFIETAVRLGADGMPERILQKVS